MFGVTLSPQTAASLGRMVIFGNKGPELPVLSVMGPWVQGLFGKYSSFSPIMAEQKCVYGHVSGDPVPQTAASLGRMVILR